MVNAHIGDLGVARVIMRDAHGAETETYDEIAGIAYESSDPSKVAVADEDAEPKDATLDFLALTDTPVVITVRFDGDPGDGLTEITLQSEEINVIPGPAVAGEIVVEFRQIT